MKYLLLFMALLVSGRAIADTPLLVPAQDWREDSKIAALFAQAGVAGTFVLYDVSARRFTGCNRTRAEKRFVPASTFKIPNTLIGLSVGAVKSVDEVFPYDGKPRMLKTWEKDMSLREAIALSAVPVYQQLARRIGLERMRKEVARLDYGNGEIGIQVDRFWLDGPLAISAVEQARFLARLAQGRLPFPPDDQESVRDITKLEEGPHWSLHGKTGWEHAPEPGVGWWVGWVKKEGRIYTFALNIDIVEKADAAKRVELGKAALQSLGILPTP